MAAQVFDLEILRSQPLSTGIGPRRLRRGRFERPGSTRLETGEPILTLLPQQKHDVLDGGRRMLTQFLFIDARLHLVVQPVRIGQQGLEQGRVAQESRGALGEFGAIGTHTRVERSGAGKKQLGVVRPFLRGEVRRNRFFPLGQTLGGVVVPGDHGAVMREQHLRGVDRESGLAIDQARRVVIPAARRFFGRPGFFIAARVAGRRFDQAIGTHLDRRKIDCVRGIALVHREVQPVGRRGADGVGGGGETEGRESGQCTRAQGHGDGIERRAAAIVPEQPRRGDPHRRATDTKVPFASSTIPPLRHVRARAARAVALCLSWSSARRRGIRSRADIRKARVCRAQRP